MSQEVLEILALSEAEGFQDLEKYISATKEIPAMSIKFKMLPTPRYLKTAKVVRPTEIINPRLELPRTIEKEKRNAKNSSKKNRGKTPKELGSEK